MTSALDKYMTRLNSRTSGLSGIGNTGACLLARLARRVGEGSVAVGETLWGGATPRVMAGRRGTRCDVTDDVCGVTPSQLPSRTTTTPAPCHPTCGGLVRTGGVR